MKHLLRFLSFIVIICISIFLPHGSAYADSSSYTILDLGTLGGSTSDGYGINNTGQVVGYALEANTTPHAFRTQPNSPINSATDDLGSLGSFGGDESQCASKGFGINSSGQAVGESGFGTSCMGEHPFFYDGTSMNDLGTLGATDSNSVSVAHGINDAGHVVGEAGVMNNSSITHVFYYDGTMHDLGFNGLGEGINNSDQIVGAYGSGLNTDHAFRYDVSDSTFHDLGSLGGGFAQAYAINNSGQVVGISSTTSNQFPQYAYRTQSNSQINSSTDDLGTLGGGGGTTANAINGNNQVVGISPTTGSGQHAFLYNSCSMTDLNTLIPSDSGWVLESGSGINDNGQITGTGFHNGVERAYLLTPSASAIQVTASASGCNTTINQGDTFSTSGSFTDSNASATSWTATVDYGDGSGAQPLTLSGMNFSLNHVYNTPGTYSVIVSVTDNLGVTGTGTVTVTVNQVIYSVTGNVYVDANHNGVKDSGESNYQGAIVTLSGASSASTTTDTNGNYTFSGLTSGSYTVNLTDPTGYGSTTTNPVSLSLNSNTTENFGITPTTEVKLTPTGDTFVNSNATTTNYGTLDKLTVEGSPTKTAYLKYDLTSLAGKTITSVKFKVTTYSDANSTSAGPDYVYLANSNIWGETTMNYNNQPGVSSTLLGTLTNLTSLNTQYSFQLDPTSIQSSTGGKLSISITTANSTDQLHIYSKEATTPSNTPKLVIDYY